MPIIDRVAQQTNCKCGRPAYFVHCPGCGSSNVEGRKRPRGEDDLKAIREFKLSGLMCRLWVCRRCSGQFTDDDRAHCDAPMNRFSVAQQRAEAKLSDTIVELQVSRKGREAQLKLFGNGDALRGLAYINTKRGAAGKRELTETEFLDGVVD